MSSGKYFLSAAVMTLAAIAMPADAKNNKNKGKGHGASAAAHHGSADERRAYSRLGDYERRILADYYGGADCPPGLAKKNNGCLPPGIAKKRYDIGSPLGSDVYVQLLPPELIGRLPVLPEPYGYRIVDGDLAVIELATLVVLDAIGFY